MGSAVVLRNAEENVLIQSGDLRVAISPQLGGKIASIHLKEMELLQTPLAPARPRTRQMPFDESDASGWDECLPSVAACTVKGPSGPVAIPDHGDLWRVAWELAGDGGATVRLLASCFSLPLRLERAIDLKSTGSGWSLRLEYALSNQGGHPVPWSWAAHPLFAVEAGDRIELPASITTLRLEGSAGRRLGKTGDVVEWPLARLSDGSMADLSKVQALASGVAEKLFAGSVEPSSAWCVLHRPSAGVRIRVRYDAAKTPYLGLWLCYGGWPERSGPKQNCVALEPATAPVDSLAQTGNWSRVLAPGATESWHMTVDFELAEREHLHA